MQTSDTFKSVCAQSGNLRKSDHTMSEILVVNCPGHCISFWVALYVCVCVFLLGALFRVDSMKV